MTDQRDYGDENDACTCSRHRVDSECPKHGHPGQLTLDPDPEGHRYEGYIDPAEQEIPY